MKLFRAQEGYRIVLVAGMMACIMSAIGELVHLAVPAFNPALLVGLSFLVVLEGIATDRVARRLPEASDRLRVHVVEWVVILLLVRLSVSLLGGVQGLAADFARWVARPQSLVDMGLVAACAALLVVYFLGLELARQIEALDADIPAPPSDRDSSAYYAWLTRPHALVKSDAWGKLQGLFLGGGVLVLVCSGLARTDLGEVVYLNNPAVAGIVGNALLYFVLGLAMLGQGHYARLRARWQQQGVPLGRPVARRWLFLALAFVALVSALALLLPTRPSLALLVAAFNVFAVALAWVYGAIVFILTGLAYLFGLLLKLLGFMKGEPAQAPAMQQPLFPTPAPGVAGQGNGWWQNIQGIVLGVLIVGVIAYALIRFLRDRKGLWQELAAQRRSPLGWLARLFTGLWGWLVRARKAVAARLQTARARSADAAQAARRRLPWARPRTEREEVRLLYLLGLYQGERQGLIRRPADTPLEHAERMAGASPETDPELRALTQGFVAARYSRREFAASEVGPLRAAYRRLRQAWLLRGKGKGPGQDGPLA